MRTDIEHPANLPKVSQAQAAELLNVSERTVRAAVRVKDEGTPELVAAVESGIARVSVRRCHCRFIAYFRARPGSGCLLTACYRPGSGSPGFRMP